jgi:hypothetical protein
VFNLCDFSFSGRLICMVHCVLRCLDMSTDSVLGYTFSIAITLHMAV